MNLAGARAPTPFLRDGCWRVASVKVLTRLATATDGPPLTLGGFARSLEGVCDELGHRGERLFRTVAQSLDEKFVGQDLNRLRQID